MTSNGQLMWSYALDRDSEVWSGACASREEAIAEGRSELADQREDDNQTFWIDHAERPKAAQYLPDAKRIIEWMGEQASDDLGEIADDWPDHETPAEAELDALLKAWAAKHFDPIRFWQMSGDSEEIPFDEPTPTEGTDK